MKRNLMAWYVEKACKNGGLVEGTLKAGFKCPNPDCLGTFSDQKPIAYNENYGNQRVLNELSTHRACPHCGIVFCLTEADKKFLEEDIKKYDLSFSK